MDVECIMHCNGYKEPETTIGNRLVYVKNDIGYHNIKIGIKEFNGNEWVVCCEASVDGNTIIKAINNAMND